MKNIKNKNKIIYILSVIVILVGVVCTAIWGFNYGVNYSEGKKITIYICRKEVRQYEKISTY